MWSKWFCQNWPFKNILRNMKLSRFKVYEHDIGCLWTLFRVAMVIALIGCLVDQCWRTDRELIRKQDCELKNNK